MGFFSNLRDRLRRASKNNSQRESYSPPKVDPRGAAELAYQNLAGNLDLLVDAARRLDTRTENLLQAHRDTLQQHALASPQEKLDMYSRQLSSLENHFKEVSGNDLWIRTERDKCKARFEQDIDQLLPGDAHADHLKGWANKKLIEFGITTYGLHTFDVIDRELKRTNHAFNELKHTVENQGPANEDPDVTPAPETSSTNHDVAMGL